MLEFVLGLLAREQGSVVLSRGTKPSIAIEGIAKTVEDARPHTATVSSRQHQTSSESLALP
jgi:hypothetical protein